MTNKADEQPTIAQARYTVADYELAEQCVSAANVVTCDGYYEVDIEKVAETLAKARTTSLAAEDGLVEALAYLESEARRFAGMYPEASDGRNTFLIFADKIASVSAIKGDKS